MCYCLLVRTPLVLILSRLNSKYGWQWPLLLFKCANSICRAVSSCFVFYSPVATLTMVQEDFFANWLRKSGEWLDNWGVNFLFFWNHCRFLLDFLSNLKSSWHAKAVSPWTISSAVFFVSVSVEAIKTTCEHSVHCVTKEVMQLAKVASVSDMIDVIGIS